jgi:hypothetical protein
VPCGFVVVCTRNVPKIYAPFLNETSACAKEAIKNAQSKNGSIIGHKTKNEDKENQTK